MLIELKLPPIRLTQYFIIDAVTTTTKNLGLIEHQLGCLSSVAHPHCKYPWPAAGMSNYRLALFWTAFWG